MESQKGKTISQKSKKIKKKQKIIVTDKKDKLVQIKRILSSQHGSLSNMWRNNIGPNKTPAEIESPVVDHITVTKNPVHDEPTSDKIRFQTDPAAANLEDS